MRRGEGQRKTERERHIMKERGREVTDRQRQRDRERESEREMARERESERERERETSDNECPLFKCNCHICQLTRVQGEVGWARSG